LGRITPLQVYMLFSQFLFSTTIGFYISPIVKEASFSVWISLILGSVIGLFITYLSIRLSMRRPDRSLGQYGHEILGKWFHYPIIIFIILMKMFSAAFLLRQLLDFVIQNFLQGTPDWAVASLFGLVIAVGIRSGPVTLFRSAQGLFFFSILAAFLFPLFAAQEINMDMSIAFVTNLNLTNTWNGGILIAGSFAEMAMIVFIFPYCGQQNKVMKALVWAVVTSIIVTLANLITCIMLFGPDLTANMTYPTLELIRYIRAGAFLENLDPLLIVFWVYTIFIKIGMLLLVAVLALTHTFGLKDHKPFSSLMAATMVILSLYMFKSVGVLEYITIHSEASIFMFTCSLFSLYLLIDWLRFGRKEKPSDPLEKAPINGS
jgi:spore germination protein KB